MRTQVVAALNQIIKMVRAQDAVPSTQVEFLIMSLVNLVFPLQDEVRRFLAGQLKKTGHQAALRTLQDIMFLPQMPRVQRRLTDILLDVLPAVLQNAGDHDDKVLGVRRFIRRLLVSLAGVSLGIFVEPLGDKDNENDDGDLSSPRRIARHLPHDFVRFERRHGRTGAQLDDCRTAVSQCVTLLRQMVMRQGSRVNVFAEGRQLLSTIVCEELEVCMYGLYHSSQGLAYLFRHRCQRDLRYMISTTGRCVSTKCCKWLLKILPQKTNCFRV